MAARPVDLHGGSATCRGPKPTCRQRWRATGLDEIDERLAKSDPGNAGWQHDLSVSLNGSIGDVQLALGNLPAALASYQASHAMFERLAKSDPGNAGWQN